jgi:uncharacterized protein (TIGR00255 family)
MKSMTGFGKAEANLPGYKIKVEVSAVNNRKGLDVVVGVPREFAALETELRELVQAGVSRGRVNVAVVVEGEGVGNGGLKINRELLERYHRELKSAAKGIGLGGGVGLEFLLRLPGVLADDRNGATDLKVRKKICGTAARALAEFQKSRGREGVFLCGKLARQIGALDRTVAGVEKRKEAVLLRCRQNLRRRLAEAGVGVPLDDERLAKEMVIFSDRCDITEEVTRLRAHFQEARRLLKTADAIGRNLDFLLQEIGREVNTIGSKANDLEISRGVVELKTELEKIREQVQNLE